MKKKLHSIFINYREFFISRNTVTRIVILPALITFLVSIVKYIESYLGLAIFATLVFLLTVLQQYHLYFEMQEREKLKSYADKYFKVLNWINELLIRKHDLIKESRLSGESANLKDESRRALLITKIVMRNFKFQKNINEIATIIHSIIREISISKYPNIDYNINIRVNIIGKNPENKTEFKVLSHKETIEDTLSTSDISDLNSKFDETIFGHLWNNDREKLISIKNTEKEDFIFFNEAEKNKLKSGIFYRIDQLVNGIKSPLSVICVDTNIPDFFPNNGADKDELNFYKIMFKSFEIRFDYETEFSILRNHIESVIKGLEQ